MLPYPLAAIQTWSKEKEDENEDEEEEDDDGDGRDQVIRKV